MNVSEAGRIGGKAKTELKAKAAKENGALGGRPIKIINLNDDGYSIKSCSHIYAPKGQALEYSALAANPYKGCGHGCKYCYVPNILRMKRRDFDSMAYERPNFIDNLTRDAKKYQSISCREQVMLSFTSDPYHQFDSSLTTKTIEVFHKYGLKFSTLTKGGTRALRDIDMFRPNMDSFASTLTSLDDNSFSKKWEPNAALPADRIKALKEFNKRGIFTWVSLEPTLNTESSKAILENTHEFVNLFKIGRANYLPMTKTTDWERYTHEMIEICQKYGIKHYIKKDLQEFLPSGYNNPLRITQHF